jgi:hypothetical protein
LPWFYACLRKAVAWMRHLWKFNQLSGHLAPMKRMTLFIFALLIVIAAVMGSLLKSGISLRVATLIKPSELHSAQQVAQALSSRLFPELQSKKWLVYSIKENSAVAKEILVGLLEIVKTSPVGEYKVQENDCEKHCVFLSETEPTEKLSQAIFAKSLEQENSNVFRLVVSEFSLNEKFPEKCETMQRLDEDCIRAISLRDARRKMTDPSKKYFFLKKYNHNQYYLFLSEIVE